MCLLRFRSRLSIPLSLTRSYYKMFCMPLKPHLPSLFLIVDRLKERLQISESINSKSLNNLVRSAGLNKRFPAECGIWMKEVHAIRSTYNKDLEAQQKEAQDQLSEDKAQTESSIRFAVVNAVFSGYPSVLAPLSGALLTNQCIARLIVPDASPLLSPLMRNQDYTVSHCIDRPTFILISFPRIIFQSNDDAPGNCGEFER